MNTKFKSKGKFCTNDEGCNLKYTLLDQVQHDIFAYVYIPHWLLHWPKLLQAPLQKNWFFMTDHKLSQKVDKPSQILYATVSATVLRCHNWRCLICFLRRFQTVSKTICYALSETVAFIRSCISIFRDGYKPSLMIYKAVVKSFHMRATFLVLGTVVTVTKTHFWLNY